MFEFMCELNQKYIQLFCAVTKAGESLPTKQVGIMYNALSEQYMDELKFYVMQEQIRKGQELFEIRYKHAKYIPKRGFLWRWNAVAKKLIKLCVKQFELMLKDIEEEIKKRSAELSEQTTESAQSDEQSANKSAEENKAIVLVDTDLTVRASQSKDSQLDE